MKQRSKAVLASLLAFAIPAAVMLWVCASMGMAPWGDKNILISDMSTQYVEFFCALKRGDLFFSWSKALGTSYIGVFSYYVSSPLSLLTLLVPNEHMPVGLMFLTVLKLGLAGLSFSLYARRRFAGPELAGLLCAVCYALMSYNAAYSLCIMWLDGLIWLPLILLALERILAGRGWVPFAAALAVCFFSTWYISYMIGAFCCLYLAARLVTLKPDKKALGRVAVRFFGGAACALGVTAWLWLPTFLAMFAGKFSGASVQYDGLLACGPLALLGQLQPGQYSGITWSALPYVYCGAVVLLLAVVGFFLRAVPLRERLADLAVLAALTASLLLSPLDKVWHLFQRPNWFPFRYAFLFSFFLIYLANRALPPILAALKGRARQAGCVALAAALVLTTAELAFNTRTILSGLDRQFRYASNTAYRDYYTANAQLADTARADSGGSFYRMGATEDRGFNSPLSFGYPGITHYSSLYNYDVNQLLKRLGFAQSWFWCAYYGSTPVTDALLGVRYVASAGDMPGYEALDRAGTYTLWKNSDVLSLAFLAQNAVAATEGATPFDRQNNLISALLGSPVQIFAPVEAEKAADGGAVSFTFTGSGKAIYADLSDSRIQQVLVNGQTAVVLGTSEAACIHCLGAPAPGEVWTVTVLCHNGYSPNAASFLRELDADVLHHAVRVLDNVPAPTVDGGRVRLEAEVQPGQTLVTTIPAEDGWAAWVDGRRVEPETWLGAFLALSLPEGRHTVELRYTAPGLYPGVAAGVLALLLPAAWALLRRKR